MIERVLLAVDDSPDSLAAARVAIALTRAMNAHLRVIHVSADHLLDAALEAASSRAEVSMRRAQSASAILNRVAALAEAAGVSAETALLAGDAGPSILDAARQWSADLVIVGRSARTTAGAPYVGAQTRHVLEFADQPVLVVPSRRR